MLRRIREGECNKCGDCCREETVPARIKAYRAAFVTYKLVNRVGGGGCPGFDSETGLCKEYENRPKECRDFPRMPVDIAALSRCSYRFVEVNDSV